MAECKYPNEVCANMTVLNGVTYCDSVPCSLKDELPKQTNADRIRSMTDEELADFLEEVENGDLDYPITFCELCEKDGNTLNLDCKGCLKHWLQKNSEV